jgi:3,4-dihydroxy 2-butanone 4-phosphate synthase
MSCDFKELMHKALSLAKRCKVTTSCFRVGAVLIQHMENNSCIIVSSGFTQPPMHAEEICINDAKLISGSYTLFTTMEPCGARLTPGKKTCVELILSYKHLIKRVVIGSREPSLFIKEPCGAKLLQEAGIEVVFIECEDINIEVCEQVRERNKRVEQGVKSLSEGKFIVVADDKDRENEGDLILLAKFATDEKMEYMRKFCSGLICVSMTGERCDKLNLPLMVLENKDKMNTAFTLSVDAVGTTTGVSGKDRAFTVTSLADAKAIPDNFNRPGHIFPLRAKDGGVLVRRGHTEASVDLAKLANCDPPVAVICELVMPTKEGRMMTGRESNTFAKKVGMDVITIEDLVGYIKIQHAK